MKRNILQSLLFSIILVILYVGMKVGIGYYKTLHYTPDIVAAYESVDYLQHEVKFGYLGSTYGLIEMAGVLLLGMVVYIMGKLLVRSFIRKR